LQGDKEKELRREKRQKRGRNGWVKNKGKETRGKNG
jgi:hypothetical protein